jgi:integrase
MPYRKDDQGRYHVELCVRRRRIHRKMPAGATQDDAKRLEAELRVALDRDTAPVIPGDPSIVALLAHYAETHAPAALRSPDTAKHHAVRIGQLAGTHTASQARQFAAKAIAAMRPHYEVGTINKSLGTLKKALTLAWEHGVTRENYSAHVKRLPEHNARDVYLTPEQVQTIAVQASENVRAAIWIALLTGARRGEVCKILAEDIGRDSILIRAGNTKSFKTRSVPIVPALRPWLRYLPLPINYEGVKTGFRRARERAGLPGVHFHDLRHSCAAILIGLGVDLYTVSKILGHASVKTTERYAHMQDGETRKALAKLGRYTESYTRQKRPAKKVA